VRVGARESRLARVCVGRELLSGECGGFCPRGVGLPIRIPRRTGGRAVYLRMFVLFVPR